MGLLEGIRGKDFLEQVSILSEIDKGKHFEALPELFDLLAEPLGDKSVDYTVVNTTKALLMANEAETVRGLGHPSPAVRRLCCRIVAQKQYASAMPVLLDQAGRETDQDLLFELLTALARLRAPESLPLFRGFMDHPDQLIASQAVEFVGAMGDAESLPRLTAVIDEAAADGKYETCELKTWKAIEAVRDIGVPAAAESLAARIHHRSPTARRIIHQSLAALGPVAVPAVGARLEAGGTDERIMAANVLGMIGDKKGADALIAAMDKGMATDPNVRFAIYEALGRIPSLKGIVCLTDGLEEQDQLVLTAVVTALDQSFNPGLAARIKSRLGKSDQQAGLILDTVAKACATTVFESLYQDEKFAGHVMERVRAVADPEARQAFRDKLQAMGAAADAESLAPTTAAAEAPAARRLLAVDDSKAMLMFYRSAASALGLDVKTATNGQEAWDLAESGETFDMVVVDMNMPVMDGIELTRRLRSHPDFASTPVLMATTESESSQVDAARKTGVTDFLSKPFTQDVFAARLRHLMG